MTATYALYSNSKNRVPARVRVLAVTGKVAAVRVTSNRHPKLRHGQHLKVSTNSLSGYYA